jgi:precorrin-6x reductase
MIKNIVLFGGTSEGRKLAEFLSRTSVHVTVSVATAYGKELLPEADNISVSCERLDLEHMQSLLHRSPVDLVIDATHPYAILVSETVQKACELEKLPLLRIERFLPCEWEENKHQTSITVPSISEAVRFLNKTTGNIFITTGSKNLSDYAAINNRTQRIYARVLPSADAISCCQKLGLPGSHIIAMQGPFSTEMNLALLHYCNAEFLVTKNSGKAGGFLEKLAAAETAGVSVIIIKPPVLENTEKISVPLLRDAVKNKRIKFVKLRGNYEEAIRIFESVLL